MRGEADRLLLAERIEVLESRITFEATKSFRDSVDRRLTLTARPLEVSEIVSFDANVFGIALVHAPPSSSMSQSTEGKLVSLMRGDGCVNVMSSLPRTVSIRARLTTR